MLSSGREGANTNKLALVKHTQKPILAEWDAVSQKYKNKDHRKLAIVSQIYTKQQHSLQLNESTLSNFAVHLLY